MNDKFAAFIFRTRGIYMFIALAVSIILKYHSGGTTPLPLFIAGITIMAAVQVFRMYAASYLWGRQAVARVEADFLCTSGPFAYVRNPLYLGNFMIGTGLCIAVNEWYAYVLFAASFAFVYYIVIPYEEKYLQEKFGNSYLEYKAHTRRLIPVLRGYRGGAEVIPDYKAGVLGELHVPIILAILSAVIYELFVM
jgi:protein-S-isoprenylcysteine O-methyltransferase Ste14